MKNFTKKILLFTKILILSLFMGGFVEYTFAQSQWVAPTVTPPSGNISLPLNTGRVLQMKNGPALLNASNIATEFLSFIPSFGLSVVHGPSPTTAGINGGVLLGKMDDPSTIPANVRPQLYILKEATNIQQPAIRVDGSGPAFVTRYFRTYIGIGTLDPEYQIDIPDSRDGNPVMRIGGGPVPQGVSLQTVGRMQIRGGAPQQNYYLSAQNAGGDARWSSAPNVTPGLNNITPPSNPQYIDEVWPNGVTIPHSIPNLQAGYWYITVFGTTGDGNSVQDPYTITVSVSGSPSTLAGPVSKSVLVRNPPQGTAPYSVDMIVHMMNPGTLNFSVGDNLGGTTYIPNINGISGYLLGA